MRDYLMLTSVISRSPSMIRETSPQTPSQTARDARIGFVHKANEFFGGDFMTIGQVGQVRLNDQYVGGGHSWDDLIE